MAPSNSTRTVAAKPNDSGFTLIELMAVVAIVSILAVIALSAYQDYSVRSRVSQGIVFAAEAKTSVSEYFYNIGSMPTSNAETGLPDPLDYDVHDHLRALRIRSTDPTPGAIELEFKIPELGTDNLLHLVPSTLNNVVTWECTPPPANGIAVQRLPPICRGG